MNIVIDKQESMFTRQYTTIYSIFNIDNPGMSFRGTTRGYPFSMYVTYDQYFDLSRPCTHTFTHLEYSYPLCIRDYINL